MRGTHVLRAHLWSLVLLLFQAATERSIVALDELGRGTATTDGAAVAAAVLQHMSTNIRCRCAYQHIVRIKPSILENVRAGCHDAQGLTSAGNEVR